MNDILTAISYMINPTKESYEIDGKIVTASGALDTVFECLDADIIARPEGMDNKQGYIKRLIREDI